MAIRYLSVCSGIEAASVAWHPLGWQAVGYAEIDGFPAHILHHHYSSGRPRFMPDPDEADIFATERRKRRAAIKAVADLPGCANGTPNFGDITQFKRWPDATFDVLVGGTPCFPAHVRIATRRGLLPISDVRVGDQVLTHKGRWRRVLATGSKLARTINLHGQGQSSGLETTAEHPFYSRTKRRVWNNEDRNWRTLMDEPEWTAAGEMVGRFWASPAKWPSSQIPKITTKGRERPAARMSPALMTVVGRWLGAGWCRINDRRGYVLICCGKHEKAVVAQELSAAGLSFSVSEERTTMRFQIASRPLAKWLTLHFGAGAARKAIPVWMFGAPADMRRALLRGYLSADGCKTLNGWRASTISDALSLGLVLLAHSVGISASRRFVKPARTEQRIEGRLVHERGFFQISTYETARSSVADGLHRWGLVRSKSAGRKTIVFNLEVEDDNSYVADGVCVHNCQSFSVAGIRKGLADPRGNLALVFLAIANRYRPRWLLWENVPGVLSSNGGRDFGAFLGGLGELGYGWAYRVLDAQYVRVDGFARAVPQRRRRVFVVGYLGDWRRAAAVLFERESLQGNPPPRREAGQRVARPVASCIPGGSGYRNDANTAENLVPICESGKRANVKDDPKNGIGIGKPGDPMFTLGTDSRHAVGVPGPAAFGGNNTTGPIDVATARVGHGGPHGRLDFETETFIAHALRADGFDASEDGTGRGTPLVPVVSAVDITNARISAGVAGTIEAAQDKGNRGQGVIVFNARQDPIHGAIGPSGPLDTDGATQAIAFSCKDHGGDAAASVAPTLRAMEFDASHANAGGQLAVAFTQNSRSEVRAIGDDGSVCGSLAADAGVQQQNYVATAGGVLYAVRRLTPMECERLQGFKDNYTLIPLSRGTRAAIDDEMAEYYRRTQPELTDDIIRRLAADGPRYKALGNSMAVNVMRWLGIRIQMVEAISAEAVN